MPEGDQAAVEAARPSGTLRLEADLAQLGAVRAFVRATASGLGADDDAVSDLVQAVDEWVTNIVRHGYGGGHGPIEVELWREGPEIEVCLRDRGPVFDPADAPPFDPGTPLHRRRPGGMGIHLMMDLMGSIEHQRRPGGGNTLTMRRSCRSTETGGIA